jgi:type II secretory pathway pseudopilin PulG
MRSPSTSTPEGFTLIEIVLAVGLFAVATGLSLGFGLSDGSAGRFRSEESTLVSALRLARAQALRNIGRDEHGVHYDRGAGCRLYRRCYVVFTGTEFEPGALGNVEFEAGLATQVAWPDHDPVFSQLDGTTEPTTVNLAQGRHSASININYEGRIDAR